MRYEVRSVSLQQQAIEWNVTGDCVDVTGVGKCDEGSETDEEVGERVQPALRPRPAVCEAVTVNLVVYRHQLQVMAAS